jgi:hypothetical protein
MATTTPEVVMYQIMSRKDEINRVASRLTGISYGVFEIISLEMPKFDPPEFGFFRVVSWLYVLYHEAGKIGVTFLSDRLHTYGFDADGHRSAHRRLVQQLRTFLQHNLDPREHHDKAVQDHCEAWLEVYCGTRVPGAHEQWQQCLLRLLEEALDFLNALLQTVRSIEQDDSREEICRAWQLRIERYHPPHAFDELIAIVAADMGRDHLDPKRLRRQFYDKWTQELTLLTVGYEFAIEVRKLIEHALLTATTPVLPITGHDIMQELGIPPGPEVGRLLQRARQLYDASPCSREMLLDQLRQERPGR